MSEEYTQSKAFLDKLYIGRYEPFDTTIARLKAERDNAVNRCKVQAETITLLQGEADKLRAERDEANAELDKAVCDLVDQNNELLAARAELAKLKSSRPKSDPVRTAAVFSGLTAEAIQEGLYKTLKLASDISKAYQAEQSEPCTLKRPTGRIESLEARIKALEGVVNAR